MSYNILTISTNNNLNDLKEVLESVEFYTLFDANTKASINSLLDVKSIHLIILNSQDISIEQLDGILKTSQKFNQNIPILIVGDESNIPNKSISFIYDFINIKSNLQFAINKINFCYSLYRQELKHEANIKELLYIDALTKFPNRVKLIRDLRDDNIGIKSLAVLDLNAFKEINDFFGHQVGDKVLRETANLIDTTIESCNSQVLLYKFSADTYCLANTGLENEDFKIVILRVLEAIEKKVFQDGEHHIDARMTAGITFSTKNNKLVTADLALQAAKKDNKRYMVFYDELDNLQEYQNNMIWTKKLKYALENDNIIVYYQPLVNNHTMKVDKYECLVRMIDDDKVISPFFFLEISKKANQYAQITRIVIEKAFKEFQNLPFEFSINVSYEDIEDKTLLEFIKEQFKKYDVASRVVWEILEDEGIKNYEVLQTFIDSVKELGCKVAIDDFGSGYSNFEHLLKMNIDYLKIDASLIKHVAKDENSYQVVKTIIEFAHSLDLKTISEYVESEEIFKITKELGSTYSQGYYFSAPLAKPNLYSF